MANRQIAGLTAEGGLDTTFVIPVQIADGSVEAKKATLAEVKTAFGITDPVEKIIKVTLSSADILALFTTPKEILPAVVGKTYIPRFVYQVLAFGTVAYTYSGNVRLAYTTASNWVLQFVPFITANDNGQSMTALNINGASATGGGYDNKSLILTALTSDPTGGDGTLDLYITYIEIDIT